MNLTALVAVVVVYTAIVVWLGWLGYRNTKSAADFLVGGRQIHPVLMALAYGSTFISTSAIVGFGGAAALFGMDLLWLTALNILVGIFIAFVVFGRPTRRLGAALDAHTFPELLGRRFDSRFIQGFAGGTVEFQVYPDARHELSWWPEEQPRLREFLNAHHRQPHPGRLAAQRRLRQVA